MTRTPGGLTSTGTGTTTTVSGLPAGTYTYTVTNAAGCISSVSGNVVINTQPATPSAPLVGTITQPTCATATGSVVMSGLPAAGTWTLTRTPGGLTSTGTGTTTTVSGLPAGTYTYTVTDADGCTSLATASVVINTQPATPAAPILGSVVQPQCSVSTGTITITAPIGTNITYSIDGSSYNNTTGIFSLVPPGTYTVTARNEFGCVSAGTSITINTPPPVLSLTSAEVTTPILCNGGTGTVTLVSKGGTTPIAYTFNGITNTNGVFNGVSAGISQAFNITDANQCGPVSGVINISQPDSIILFAVPTNVTCKGSADGSINLTATGGNQPYIYSWTGPGTFTSTAKDLAGLSGGTYTVTVTDANGCTKTTSSAVHESSEALAAVAKYQPAVQTMSINGKNLLGFTGGIINLNVSGGTAPYSYSWTGPDSFTSSSEDLTDLASGTYSVALTDANGCTTTVSVLIDLQVVLAEDSNCPLSVPNSFSPNADGINDNFVIKCLYNYTNPIIEIYNRWGNLLYKKEHYGDVDYWGSETDAWWNGRSENKLTIGSKDLPVGTYYYILKLDHGKVLTGFIFLNR